MSNRPRTPSQQIEADGIARTAARAANADLISAGRAAAGDLIADLQSRLESVRDQRDAAQRERNRLMDERDALRIQVAYERDRADIQTKLVKQLAGERNFLGKRLTALTASVAGAADEYGLREEAGE